MTFPRGALQDEERWSVAKWSRRSAPVVVREWRRLVPFGPPELWEAGSRLTEEGLTPRTLFLIESGVVKLSCWTAHGPSRNTALLLRYPGDVVGECSVLLNIPQLTSAVAVSKCHISRVGFRQAVEVFRNNPEAAAWLAKRQAIDSVRITALLLEQRYSRADQKLFGLLSEMAAVLGAERSGGRVSFRLPLKKADLADLIAVTPSSFSRLHRRLTRLAALRQIGKMVSFRERSADIDDHPKG